MTAIYRGMDRATLDAAYDNTGAVADSQDYRAHWWEASAEIRAQPQSKLDVRYGARPRAALDYFPSGATHAPLFVFIHGGYWQALDGSSFSHCARGLNVHGIGVAIPTYDLCPGVTVDTIIWQMRAATRELARSGCPLVMSGHSAGGHLAACMLATDWPAVDAALPKRLVIGAYAISGLFDLAPLLDTSINKALRLDKVSAKAASPLFWTPREGTSLDAVVGAQESAEYVRQSRIIVEQWATAGVKTRFGMVADANHFTAIAPLADPDSPMVTRLKQLARP